MPIFIDSTRLVRLDDSRAHKGIVDAFKRFAVVIESYAGDVQEIRGDALLAVFSRASDAVQAALNFQQEHTRNIQSLDSNIQPRLRVGIAMGEVIIADGTLTGAGVILAQRLEQLATAGSVVIQGAVYETLPKNLPLKFSNLGEQSLKGFDEMIRAYGVMLSDAISTEIPESSNHTDIQPRTSLEKPSIAVLPFTNQSGDSNQEYFSDGISEDIITELSRFHALFVIARSSSFRYKNSTQGVQEVGRELGVQYIVEGSVRRAGNRIRIVAQLVEVETEKHVWAERFDRQLEDIFDVQDEVTRSIVAVLPGRVQEDVVDRAARKPTENMKAYEYMLQGKAHRDLLSAQGNAAARMCCERL